MKFTNVSLLFREKVLPDAMCLLLCLLLDLICRTDAVHAACLFLCDCCVTAARLFSECVGMTDAVPEIAVALLVACLDL